MHFDLKLRVSKIIRKYLVVVALLAHFGPVSGQVQTLEGKLDDGTSYRIDRPEDWNGTLLVGLDYAGRDPLAAGEAGAANRYLIEHGFALAGTTRAVTGWAIQLAARNALQTLDIFTQKFGKPKYAVEFGGSMGGHTAAVTLQAYPTRWNGAVIMCGGLSGTVGQWQGKFDGLWVAKTLVAPESSLPVIHIPKDFQTAALPAWRQMFATTGQTPQGKARAALAAIFAQMPDWSDRTKPRPASDDLEAREDGLVHNLITGLLPQAMSSRSQIETLSGGNITSNNDVDYAELLKKIDKEGLAAKIYAQAGLDLSVDLALLAKAPRISADPAAIAYVASGVFDGALAAPVLTMSGIGDPISTVPSQESYASAVARAGKSSQLRQVYTASTGHCGFTPAETVAAVEVLKHRLDSGKWDDTSMKAMNDLSATTLIGPSRFIDFTPPPFGRPYTACDLNNTLKAARIKPLETPGQELPRCNGSR